MKYAVKFGAKIPLFALAAFLVSTNPASAQETPPLKVTVSGAAEGTGFAARDRAVAAAQQRAVVDAIEALVADKELRSFLPIIRRAAGYVQSYSLIEQSAAESGVTRVTLELTLNEQALRNDVADLILPRLPVPPTVLLLAAERLDAAPQTVPEDDNATAEALLDALENAPLEFQSLAAIRPYYSNEALKGVSWGDLDVGRQFARENEADAVVLASSVAAVERIAEGASALRHTAIVTLRVFRGDDGKLVDVIVSEAVVNGQDPRECAPIAFGDAARKAATALRTAAAIAKLGTPEKDEVHLRVEHPGTRERLAGLVAILQRDPQVLHVDPRFFHPDLARLRIEYSGSIPRLIEPLLREGGKQAPELLVGSGRSVTLAYPER